MMEGHATAEGTLRYSERFAKLRDAGHFRQRAELRAASELWFPSIGLGTYLGDPDDASDQMYEQSIETALRHGINLLDTAINYRHQRSERNIGAALRRVVEAGEIFRDEVIVCSKAGFLAFDGAVPADPSEYFVREYVKPGIFKRSDLAGRMHCMTPAYLENQLERSRRNLGLTTIDVYYIHNPESQLADLTAEEFRGRLTAAFEAMEKAVASGKIRWYGIASWNAFRVPEPEQGFLSLEECVRAAEHAGGKHHHFGFVQLPFSLAMPEAHAATVQNSRKEYVSLFEAAARHGIAVIGSASLYQGQLAQNLPVSIQQRIGMKTDAQRALQFARSAPGLLTALVGMGRSSHVLENIHVAEVSPMAADKWKGLFTV